MAPGNFAKKIKIIGTAPRPKINLGDAGESSIINRKRKSIRF